MARAFRKIKPFENGLEFSDNIREVVTEFISQKIPVLKEEIPSLEDLDDKKFLEALAHNWFSAIGEEVDGKRREVLLATMAHVVKRIENYTYKKRWEKCRPRILKNLGLIPTLAIFLCKFLIPQSKRIRCIFVFWLILGLHRHRLKKSGPVTFSLPGHEKLYTTATFFPHEAQFLAKRFGKIAENHEKWSSKPGGDIFKQYLEVLSVFYAERDPTKAPERQKEVERLYQNLLGSDFPILITPATEGYYKEPYFDPELKVSVTTPDARKEVASWIQAKEAMSASLENLDAAQFSEKMRDQPIRSAHVFGGFGVNITFNAVAQENRLFLYF